MTILHYTRTFSKDHKLFPLPLLQPTTFKYPQAPQIPLSVPVKLSPPSPNASPMPSTPPPYLSCKSCFQPVPSQSPVEYKDMSADSEVRLEVSSGFRIMSKAGLDVKADVLLCEAFAGMKFKVIKWLTWDVTAQDYRNKFAKTIRWETDDGKAEPKEPGSGDRGPLFVLFSLSEELVRVMIGSPMIFNNRNPPDSDSRPFLGNSPESLPVATSLNGLGGRTG
ncbi:hypothetical protein DL98DRAFT_527930 [Cadophora sp. DSE1049]|nr:hypothetical protein DL98DRAFT_527930 [Cadophora sp. DSE1049]